MNLLNAFARLKIKIGDYRLRLTIFETAQPRDFREAENWRQNLGQDLEARLRTLEGQAQATQVQSQLLNVLVTKDVLRGQLSEAEHCADSAREERLNALQNELAGLQQGATASMERVRVLEQFRYQHGRIEASYDRIGEIFGKGKEPEFTG